MDMSVPQKLQTYINAELHDSALYRALASSAPNEDDRRLLLEFSGDELSHANEFKRLYRQITGHCYNPEIQPLNFYGTYREILQERVLDESGDFRKYGEQYLQTNSNKALKNAYYRARTDENVHALRLLYMLSR